MEKLLKHYDKQQVVEKYIKKFSIETFVETGTYKGDMVYAILPYVKEIYSVELDENLCEYAQKRFAGYSNVHIIRGESGKVLAEIIPEIKARCLFWLDAHFSGGITAKGETETPITQELQAILNSPYDHIILIDDARHFTGENDYPTLKSLEQVIRKVHPNWTFEVQDDIIRIHCRK